MRRFKNSGIFKNTSLSFDSDELYFHGIHSASYDRLIVGFTHTSGSAKILELKNNKHNDVCLMKRMEWNSCEYETLFTLPEKSSLRRKCERNGMNICKMASKYANCQFHEESPDVKWHCKTCDLNLCDICNTKIHSKSEKLSEHKVELLKDGDENISRDIPVESVLEVKPPELYYIEPIDVNMGKVLGSIINKPKVVLIKTFEVNFPKISGLVCLNDDIFVMYNKRSRKFKYFTISYLKFVTTKNDIGDESRKNRNVEILDITNYNKEVLLCDDTFQMRCLRNYGTFDNIPLSLTDEKLVFHCIHTTNGNDVIVSLSNTERNSTVYLEISDTNYASKIRRVECDSASDIKLFDFPKKITTDINRDIYVLDHTDNAHRVVSIGKWGQSKWTYSGHQSLNPVSSAAQEK
ncbi:unnamed protein product [Mytilus edulis]|uniref:B box-type domain-containing protein n=1 Tax=Mytilus edulis TaxID=6550 RepID=A0A8S3R8L5_MYTED|nr:unnamed protein product [Mytilus edulis]